MTIDNCPQCGKKLPTPFKSSGRQVCSGCGWSDRPKKNSFNSEKKTPIKHSLPISVSKQKIGIAGCSITALFFFAFCSSQALVEKCSDTNWELSDLSSVSNLEILNLSQGKKSTKIFECYRSVLHGHKCSNGKTTVELQDYMIGFSKEYYRCTDFIDQNKNQYCLEYLEFFDKVTHLDDACTIKKTEITTVFGLSKSKNVPEPLIFNHTQTWVYEGSEYEEIEF